MARCGVDLTLTDSIANVYSHSIRVGPVRKKPLQQRSQQMVETLIEAAGQVIAERGLEHFTTVQVAARARVSVGSLYQYFANKDALLAALLDRLNREMGEMVNRIYPTGQREQGDGLHDK